MHVAIPFDVETVKRSFGQAARMWGRVVANHDFVTALAAAPGCRRLTLLVPARGDVALLQDTLLAGGAVPAGKVQVVPYGEVPGWLGRDPPDVMHVLDPNLWMAAHLRGQLALRPFVVTGVTHSLANQHFLPWALLNDANGVTGRDCLVCTTPSAQAVVAAMFARLAAGRADFRAPRTRVIPLGVGPVPVNPERTACRRALGLDEQSFVVLSLARFNPQFKMDLLPVLQLAALLSEGVARPVRFILAGSSDGDGEYLAYVRGCARDAGVASRVDFAANPDEARKGLLLGAADAFVSLSDNIQETFGLTVLEALSRGLPVIASDWDGYRHLVEDGRSGFLVPTRGLPPDPAWDAMLPLRYDPLLHLFSAQATAVDLDQAAARVRELAADESLRQRMSRAASQRSREFAWPVVMDAYLALWRELLAAGPAAADGRRSSALSVAGDFAGYPTAVLQPGDAFRTTGLGQRALAGQAPLRLYAETDEFLDRELMGGILRACVAGARVQQLAALANALEGEALRRLNQNVLWLYKQGFLRPA